MSTRFDAQIGNIEMLEPERSAEGFLKCHAIVARTGVLIYRDSAGVETAELIPPDELFGDSLASLGGKPVTNEHPLDDDGKPLLVSPDTSQTFARGAVGNDIRGDRVNGLVRVTLDVHDGATIADIDAGKREVSLGRSLTIDSTPGVWDAATQTYWLGDAARGKRGVHFDAVQRNFTHNHLAIVDKGRAGRQVAMRIDSAISVGAPTQHQRRPAMAKIRIDSVEYDVDAGVATAIAAQQTASKERMDASEARVVELEAGKLTAAGVEAGHVATIAEMQARLDGINPQALLAARRALELRAAPLLSRTDSDEATIAALDDRSLQLLAIQVIQPAFTGEGMTDAQISLFFDGVTAAVASVPVHANDGRGSIRTARADSAPVAKLSERKQRWNDRFDFNATRRNQRAAGGK